MSTISNTEPIERQKFLFLFPIKNVSTRCCCGCSLQKGVIALSIIFSIIYTISFISNFSLNFSFFLFLEQFFMVLLTFSYIILMISAFNENYKYAQFCYLVVAILFYLNLFAFIIIIPSKLSVVPFSYMAMYIGMYITLEVLKLYFIWVIFSYTKLLKFRKTDVVKGKQNDQVEHNYGRVNEESTSVNAV